MPSMRSESACVVSSAPIPMSVVTTGTPKVPANSVSAPAACVAVDHAAAGVDERPAGLPQHGEEALGRGRVERRLAELLHAAAVAGNRQQALALENTLPVLDVLGDIHDHRTGAPRAGDFERRAHRGLELGWVRDEENMLCDRSHHGGYRRLLERVGADGRGSDLPANHDNRY